MNTLGMTLQFTCVNYTVKSPPQFQNPGQQAKATDLRIKMKLKHSMILNVIGHWYLIIKKIWSMVLGIHMINYYNKQNLIYLFDPWSYLPYAPL